MVKTYYACVERGKRNFGVFFPDLEGCIAVGDTVKDALANAQEALSLHIEGMKEDDDPIPAPEWDGQEETLDPDYRGLDFHCASPVYYFE